MKLEGRSAIVTGSSTGLGYAIAHAFLTEGANVAICGRDPVALAAAARTLERETLEQPSSGGQQVLAVECDVADPVQVNGFCEQAIAHFGSVEILVNNAGVLGPVGRTEDVDLAQWRSTVDTNLFGVVHSCRALLPHFKTRGSGKIINLSGGGATSPRPFFSAYATSKAAVVRLTENLAEEMRGSGIDINAVAPGALNTRMLEETIAAGRDNMGDKQFSDVSRQKQSGGSSMEKAADLCVYLASPQSDGISGRLISAAWDDWRSLHQHAADLCATDIYTLRRITPADRERSWG